MNRTTTFSHQDCISERRIRNNRLRRKQEMRRNFLIILMTVCLVVTLAVSVGSFLSNAKTKDEPVCHKYYASIVVESGDSLWSLAGDHMGPQYANRGDYVKEVMRINSLTNDKIVSGQHLVIPYYSTHDMN